MIPAAIERNYPKRLLKTGWWHMSLFQQPVRRGCHGLHKSKNRDRDDLSNGVEVKKASVGGRKTFQVPSPLLGFEFEETSVNACDRFFSRR